MNALPRWIHVVVRGWLNSNQVVMRGRDANVVVDSGYVTHAQRTIELLRAPEALGQAPLDLLVNTHCHSDHMGGNASLARAFGCSIAIPGGAVGRIEHWDRQTLWLSYAEQDAEPFRADRSIDDVDVLDLGEGRWTALAAPGHDATALMFHCEEHGVLLTGDALWENGMGAILAPAHDTAAFDAAMATLDRIESLAPRCVIPGHGVPFTDVAAALQRARGRLVALRDDPRRAARHVMKVMLTFSLLAAGRIPLAALPEAVDRVPVLRELNAAWFRLPAPELASLLVGELERAGAVAREGAALVPLIAA